MKKLLVRIVLLVAVYCAGSIFLQAQQVREALTNAAVVKLVRAGFKEKTIIAVIRSRTTRFELDPDKLIELKQNGVSENIILAMLAQDESFALADDEWTDESGFRGGMPKLKRRDAQSDGSDIFGSGQSSSGRTSGRGMMGGNQDDTSTTGNATVRIIRPPAESGSASLKLEKTPTLNNESVIRLVEAGFSEGTIIKRIEDSPADFDLSVSKLAELRRRRVTEAIISAMTSAMSEDSDTKPVTPPRNKGN